MDYFHQYLLLIVPKEIVQTLFPEYQKSILTDYFLCNQSYILNHLYKTLLTFPYLSHLNKTNKRLVTQLAINCLILSIYKEKFHNCTFLIAEITKLLDNELNYYEQTVFLYAKGYFEFKKNLDTGVEKMKQAIQVFDILEEQNMKSQYIDHFSQNVEIR